MFELGVIGDISTVKLLNDMTWRKSWIASKLGADGGFSLTEVEHLLRYHVVVWRIAYVETELQIGRG